MDEGYWALAQQLADLPEECADFSPELIVARHNEIL
jgi:hypothetical protein